MFQQAVGGAILAELILEGRLKTVVDGRSTYATVVDPTPLDDDVLDDCLERVATASRRGKLATWVQRFGGMKGVKHRVAASLVRKGILREDEGRVMLLFTRRLYPELDPVHERRIVERIEAAISSDTATVDPRTTVLIALAHHAGLLKVNIDRARLRARRDRVRSIIKGDAVGNATKQAVEATQAAIFAAVIGPAITS
jgi:hypothetical protein